MNDWQDAERHVERAHELYELGRWDEAESALRQALSLNPYQAEWHFNLGLTLAAAGRHEAALAAFTESHELGESTDTQAPLEIAGVLMDLERTSEAVDWLTLVLERQSDSVDAHVQLIDAYAILERHEDAELHFYMALQIDPESASAYSTMAESLIDRRQLDRASWCLQQASQLDPTLPRVFARMAHACSLTGRYERARQLYTREIRSNPGDVETIVEFGRLLMDMNRPGEAAEKFRRALEMAPDDVEAHLSLGELAEAGRDLETARQHYTVAVKLDPAYGGVRRKLARVLLDLDRRRDSQAARVLVLQELADLKRDRGESDVNDVRDLTELLLDMSLSDGAVQAASVLAGERPNDATSHHLLSVALFSVGRSIEGIDAARRAVRLRPNFVAPMHNLAVAYLRRGEISRARYWVRHGLALESDDRGLRRLRAYLRVHALKDIMHRVTLMFRGSR